MKCSGCGAENLAGAAICEFCGSALPTVADDRPLASFTRVKASKAYAARSSPQRLARLPSYTAVHKVATYGFFFMFIGVGLFIFVMTLVMAGMFGVVGRAMGRGPGTAFSLVPLCMAVVPALLVACGVWAFWKTSGKMRTHERAPVQSLAVIVVDKRTHVSGGGDDSRASTAYYVTSETEDGQRREYQVWDGEVYGKMAAGEAGVLFLRAGCALDFDRV